MNDANSQNAEKTFPNDIKITPEKTIVTGLLSKSVRLDVLFEGENIFICTFDRFKRDEPVYFFRSWDVEKGLPLDDLSYTIVLNTKCSPEKVPEALKPFYEYLNDPKKNQASELTRMIDERVRKFNSDGWRKKYMTFEYMLNERERKGLELGMEQGRSEGEAIGLEKGRSEGVAQEKREIAKSMIKEGIAKEVIEKITGLSKEEVEAL